MGKGTLGNAWVKAKRENAQVKSAANSNNGRDFEQGGNMVDCLFFRALQPHIAAFDRRLATSVPCVRHA
jgi:hypothetical protein